MADHSETLYAAFEPTPGGRKHAVYQWSLPDNGAQRRVPESIQGCMECGRHFGLLEPRRTCGGCGGAFCGSHALHVEFFEHRYCATCRDRLGEAEAAGIVGRSRLPSVAPSAAGSRVGSRQVSRRPSIEGGAAPRVERERGRSVGDAAAAAGAAGSGAAGLQSPSPGSRSASKTGSRSGSASRSGSVSRERSGSQPST